MLSPKAAARARIKLRRLVVHHDAKPPTCQTCVGFRDKQPGTGLASTCVTNNFSTKAHQCCDLWRNKLGETVEPFEDT